MTWHEAWGTWGNRGAQGGVAMVGSPSSSIMNFPLAKAKQAGYGKGVEFVSNNDAGTDVSLELNLIGIAVQGTTWDSSLSAYTSPQPSPYSTGWDYDWFVDIYISSDGGRSYNKIIDGDKVASHPTPQALAYHDVQGLKDWRLANVSWRTRLRNLPANFTHLKLEIRGEEPDERHQNVFPRRIVLPPPPPPELTTRFVENTTGSEIADAHVGKSFVGAKDISGYEYDSTRDIGTTIRIHYYNIASIKPWAIRKSGVFKTIDRPSGYFKIRRSVRFVDKSTMTKAQVNKPNQGSSRIRKNNTWVGQNKIGEQ